MKKFILSKLFFITVFLIQITLFSAPSLKKVDVSRKGKIKKIYIQVSAEYPAIACINGKGKLLYIKFKLGRNVFKINNRGVLKFNKRKAKITKYPFDVDSAIAEKIKTFGKYKLDYNLSGSDKYIKGKIKSLFHPKHNIRFYYHESGEEGAGKLKQVKFWVNNRNIEKNIDIVRYKAIRDKSRSRKVMKIAEVEKGYKTKGSVKIDYVPSQRKKGRGQILRIEHIVGRNFIKYTFKMRYNKKHKLIRLGSASFKYKGRFKKSGRQPGIKIKIVQ